MWLSRGGMRQKRRSYREIILLMVRKNCLSREPLKPPSGPLEVRGSCHLSVQAEVGSCRRDQGTGGCLMGDKWRGKNPRALYRSSFIPRGQGFKDAKWVSFASGRSHWAMEKPWVATAHSSLPGLQKRCTSSFFSFVLTSLRHLIRRCGLALIRVQALLGPWYNNPKPSPLLVSSLTQNRRGQAGCTWVHSLLLFPLWVSLLEYHSRSQRMDHTFFTKGRQRYKSSSIPSECAPSFQCNLYLAQLNH